MQKKLMIIMLTLYAISYSNLIYAGKANVIDVKIKKNAENLYHFKVTVRHKDAGWQHYADRWEVLDLKGNVLVTRVLAHPHVEEQPFTRSLTNVKIPSKIKEVIVRAHDKVHGYGGIEKKVKLPK